MAAASWFRYSYLAYASRPKSTRQLYRLVKAQRVCRILEIGIGDVSRSVSMIEVAQRYAGDQKVRHTGLDWFDARAQALPPLTLKNAYRALHATGACVRLVPGTPASVLISVANAQQNTDLVLISSSVHEEDLQAAWFYVPRMLHPNSTILRERGEPGGEPSFERLTHTQVAEWAGRCGRRAA